MTNEMILRAADFAAHKHKNQRRKDLEASPYINHPIRVAKVIAEIGGVDDADVLAGALLHDTLEDTETTPEELERAFGPRVKAIVEAVTDDKSLPKQRRKTIQVEHAAGLSPEAALVKLGDKICNVTDVMHSPPDGWPAERKIEYIEWAMRVIENCPRVNSALEAHFADLARSALNEL